jgi:hypothetical protein
MDRTTNIAGISLGLLCCYSAYTIFRLQKKIDECHKLLQTMATLPRSNDTIIQDTIIQDTIIQDTIIQDTIVQDTIIQDTIIQDTIIQDTIIQDVIVEDAIVEDTVVQDTIIEDVIVKKVSNNVSSPVVITDEHPDDMYEELSHYFVTDEISKPISRTTLLTSAKNLLGL